MERKKHRTSNIEHRASNLELGRRELDGDAWRLRESPANSRVFDLEERLLEFASAIIDLTEILPNSRAGNHVALQMLRSGTSPYPNHGEAESAESSDDFVHKLKICLKELRETRRWARLIVRKGCAGREPCLGYVLQESDELIRIFVSSIRTARRNAVERPSQRDT